jgi:hypothetical protein
VAVGRQRRVHWDVNLRNADAQNRRHQQQRRREPHPTEIPKTGSGASFRHRGRIRGALPRWRASAASAVAAGVARRRGSDYCVGLVWRPLAAVVLTLATAAMTGACLPRLQQLVAMAEESKTSDVVQKEFRAVLETLLPQAKAVAEVPRLTSATCDSNRRERRLLHVVLCRAAACKMPWTCCLRMKRKRDWCEGVL